MKIACRSWPSWRSGFTFHFTCSLVYLLNIKHIFSLEKNSIFRSTSVSYYCYQRRHWKTKQITPTRSSKPSPHKKVVWTLELLLHFCLSRDHESSESCCCFDRNFPCGSGKEVVLQQLPFVSFSYLKPASTLIVSWATITLCGSLWLNRYLSRLFKKTHMAFMSLLSVKQTARFQECENALLRSLGGKHFWNPLIGMWRWTPPLLILIHLRMSTSSLNQMDATSKCQFDR